MPIRPKTAQSADSHWTDHLSWITISKLIPVTKEKRKKETSQPTVEETSQLRNLKTLTRVSDKADSRTPWSSTTTEEKDRTQNNQSKIRTIRAWTEAGQSRKNVLSARSHIKNFRLFKRYTFKNFSTSFDSYSYEEAHLINQSGNLIIEEAHLINQSGNLIIDIK